MLCHKTLTTATELSKHSDYLSVVSHFFHYLSLLTFTRSTVPFLKSILPCTHSLQPISLNEQFHKWTSSTSKSTHKPLWHGMTAAFDVLVFCKQASDLTSLSENSNYRNFKLPTQRLSITKTFTFHCHQGCDGEQEIVTLNVCFPLVLLHSAMLSFPTYRNQIQIIWHLTFIWQCACTLDLQARVTVTQSNYISWRH